MTGDGKRKFSTDENLERPLGRQYFKQRLVFICFHLIFRSYTALGIVKFKMHLPN